MIVAGRRLMLLASAGWLFSGGCHLPATRQEISFTGSITAGERFEHRLGERFIFALEPTEFGWRIAIYEKSRDEDLSRLTPPFHFVPNPRWIEGWHFRNEENTGPNVGSVNAPQREREFIFSPKVGRTIQGPAARASATSEELVRVESFGKGTLWITNMTLSPPERSKQARLMQLSFKCDVSWPRQ